MRFVTRDYVMLCTKMRMLSGGRPSSASTVSMILADSALEEARPALEVGTVLVGVGNDALARRADAVDEGQGRRVREVQQRRGRLMREAAAVYLLWRMVISSKSATPNRLRCQRRSKIRPRGGVKVGHLWRTHETVGRA
ncbi:MAG: hypothetical protein VR78_15485 [Hoeflea sp. BRH_c9]|nr:MAG: hypothetical protein VR78_15485 [Hoeflea sp. BRH_c9]